MTKLSSHALASLATLMLVIGDAHGSTNPFALRGTSSSFSPSFQEGTQPVEISLSTEGKVKVCSNDEDWLRVVPSAIACNYFGDETLFEFLRNSTQTQDLEDRLSAIEAQVPSLGVDITSSLVPLCISNKTTIDPNGFVNFGRMKYLPPNNECDEANQEFNAVLFADGTMDYRIILAEVELLGATEVPGYDYDPDVVHFCPLNDQLWMGQIITTTVDGCEGPHYRHLLQPVDLVDFETRVAALEDALVSSAPSSSPSSSPTESYSGSISGYVLEDTNLDDEGDSPMFNVPLALVSATGGMITTTRTLTDGSYSFGGLDVGQYTVMEVNLPGYPVDVSDADGGIANEIVVDLSDGGSMHSADNNFVDRKGYTISGQVREDANDDNTGDFPVGDVNVTLTGPHGNAKTRWTLTEPIFGGFSFAVDPGVYTLVLVVPDEYDYVWDADGDYNMNFIDGIDASTSDNSNNYFVVRAKP